jgi:acyl carrier protein
MPTSDDVRAFVVHYLRAKLAKHGISQLEDDVSMTDSGIIDSFGLLDLVTAVERKFAIQVDMGDVDIDTFTTFGGFVRTVSGTTG